MSGPKSLKVRRVLLSVSDKTNLVPLARAFVQAGAELVATGGTARILKEESLPIVPIESLSGSPEAFQGRMKTLSFPVCSGILYRRGDASDAKDLQDLKIQPIDCVVVNFYPFEAAVASLAANLPVNLIEEVDIGGPTLVRAAAKNAPDVLVLTSPSQYTQVIEELKTDGCVSLNTVHAAAKDAWDFVVKYDEAISLQLGNRSRQVLRYGENPHQKGMLEFSVNSPIAWENPLTGVELSYNNILDLSAAYALASDLVQLAPNFTGVVIVKHNNPCGVALVPKSEPQAQMAALLRAWEGDPVSAFGGVLVFTDPLGQEEARWLSEHFVELIAAPQMTRDSIAGMVEKRKKLKALSIRSWGGVPAQTAVSVPGGILKQDSDVHSADLTAPFKVVTRAAWPTGQDAVARFGIAVCRALKSNAIALVRALPQGGFQLVGAGQGQPNRIDALEVLAVPRAKKVLEQSQGTIGDCVLVSDAFFPFRDTVDAAHRAGIRAIVQPGGSMRDAESIAACDEHGIAMVLTGVRHFRH